MERIDVGNGKVGEQDIKIGYFPVMGMFEIDIGEAKIIASYAEFFDIVKKISMMLWDFYIQTYEKSKNDPDKMKEFRKLLGV